MALMDTVDGVLIDSDEGGFSLTLSGVVAEHRFRLPPDIAIELLRAVKREIEPWYLEGVKEQAIARLEKMNADAGYPLGSPKHPDYHDTMSDIWDSREGK